MPAGADPGLSRPDNAPLLVGRDRQTDEYVELWLQKDTRLDSRATCRVTTSLSGLFGWGYVTRRSGGTCFDAQGWHQLRRVHLCAEWPCPSIKRLKDGSECASRWGLYGAPWHLQACEGWPQGVAPGQPPEAAGAPEGAGSGPAAGSAAPGGAAQGSAAGLRPGPTAPGAIAEPVGQGSPEPGLGGCPAGAPDASEGPAPAAAGAPTSPPAEPGPGLEAAAALGGDASAGADGPAAVEAPERLAPPVSVEEAMDQARMASADAAAAGERNVWVPTAGTLRLRDIAPALGSPDAGRDGARAAPPAPPEPAPLLPLASAGQDAVSKLLALSRQVRRPRTWVGYSAFVVFGALRGIRVHVWEGRNRVDVTRVFLPAWLYEKLEDNAVADAALCAAVADERGPPQWAPVSEERPAGTCSHYVVLQHSGELGPDGGNTSGFVDGFYAAVGYVVVSTKADGDCGIDALLQMLGCPSNALSRRQLREEPRGASAVGLLGRLIHARSGRSVADSGWHCMGAVMSR